MTAAADEAWIENSLARLEQLEGQRQQLAATGQTQQLAELDEEIRSLYEVLESVANDDEPTPAPANTASPAMAAAPMAAAPMAAAPMAAAPMAAAPMAAAPMASPGMAPPGMAPPGMAPMGMASPDMAPIGATLGSDAYDDDIKPPRSPLPFILVGLLVLGGGVAAYMFMGKSEPEEAKPQATGPATVIKAGAVVEDTQEPQVAQGADADRTRGTNFKEGSSSKSTNNRPRNSGSRPHSPRKKKDDGRKIEVGNTKDPLGGVN